MAGMIPKKPSKVDEDLLPWQYHVRERVGPQQINVDDTLHVFSMRELYRRDPSEESVQPYQVVDVNTSSVYVVPHHNPNRTPIRLDRRSLKGAGPGAMGGKYVAFASNERFHELWSHYNESVKLRAEMKERIDKAPISTLRSMNQDWLLSYTEDGEEKQ